MDALAFLDERVAQVIRELEEDFHKTGQERMWAPKLHPESARFLHMLVLIGKYRRLLEIGGGVGYSTLWLAHAAHRNGGHLVTCEIEVARAEVSRRHVRRAGLHGVVTFLIGDARQTVGELAGPFDFVLIDTTKADYITYFELVTPKLLPNGLIVADNVTSHAKALAPYIQHVRHHPLYESITVPIGKGLELSRRVR
ncbi:MAG: O-methyltransferase [Chloroflexi bacterium]|nr:O-methyltransferase [Chloroflexota bacterium]